MNSKFLILSFIITSFLVSCSKEVNDVFVEPTALKFTQKEPSNVSNFKYKYTLLKYNNSWYGKTINDKQERYTDLIQFTVYSNKEKPLNIWIGYREWMRDTSIMTFDNKTIDSCSNMVKVEANEDFLYQKIN